MAGLKINAFHGARGYVTEDGWKPTSAAFILTVLRAKYPNSFLWPQIEEFKQLNDIPDWEPDEYMNADGVVIGQDGEIFLPDGFDLEGWNAYYADWKGGYEISSLPPRPTIQMQPTQTQSPVQTYEAPPPVQTAQAFPGGNSAPPSGAPSGGGMPPATQQQAQKPTAQPQQPGTIFGVPAWMVGVGGAVAGAVVLSMLGEKKGKGKRK